MDCKERILSDNYLENVVDFPVNIILETGSDSCYIPLGENYSVVYQNRLSADPRWGGPYEYRYRPKLYGLMELTATQLYCEPFDPTALISSGILAAQREPLNLTGRGCIFCCIDTGVDYTDPVFRREDGSSRILAIWDQTIQEGTPPDGLYFGSEYTREQINEALQAENPYDIVPSRDTDGHGSAMAGVAVGSRLGSGSSYLGAAPDADIVVVKLKPCKPYLREYYFLPQDVPAYSEGDIMLAVKYADSFAEALIRPVIICLGIGTNMGDHNGSSFLAGYLNRIGTRRSRVVVVGGGNEGNAAHHFYGQLSVDSGRADNYRDVEVRVADGVDGFVMEFWGNVPDLFNMTIRSPGGETIPPIRLGVESQITHRFIYERTEITIQSVLVEANSGEQLMLFRVAKPTAGIWNFRVSAARQLHNGSFHLWLPITAFLSAECYFLEPDPYTTLTEPSLASGVISVSTYNDRNNSFFLESGRGFSRTGQIRPDLAAPGVNICTIRGRRTGSSLAAAMTAGAAVQFMQWAVVEENSRLAETREVSNYFIQGAIRSPERSYPNREWGFGRLNLRGVFDVLAGITDN